MQYMLLIFNQHTDEPFTDGDALMGEFMTYTQELVSAGVLVGGDPLTGPEDGKRVGQGTVTDGPFADTTEHLGGYYILDVPSIDEAVAWAQKVPSVVRGLDVVEVRTVINMG